MRTYDCCGLCIDPPVAIKVPVKWTLPFLLLAAAAPALAVGVGDSIDKVIAEKGRPVGIMSGGTLKILTYPDVIIKVRDGAVISVRSPDKPHVVYGGTPAPEPAHASVQVVAQAPRPSVAGGGYDGPAMWETDVGAALVEAKARGRHLLVLFTGSDWCPWCQKMDAEVYSQPAFAAYSHDKFVLLKLDYPRHTPQPDVIRLQNEEMQRRCRVGGFPCAIIMDGDSNVLTRIEGYRQGGPDAFVQMMRSYE
jgi:hypothetical protein